MTNKIEDVLVADWLEYNKPNILFMVKRYAKPISDYCAKLICDGIWKADFGIADMAKSGIMKGIVSSLDNIQKQLNDDAPDKIAETINYLRSTI